MNTMLHVNYIPIKKNMPLTELPERSSVSLIRLSWEQRLALVVPMLDSKRSRHKVCEPPCKPENTEMKAKNPKHESTLGHSYEFVL